MAGEKRNGPARFATELARRGVGRRCLELPGSTRTAAEAAVAIGCDIGAIAKSIVFRDCDAQRPLLVIASGQNRVSTAALAALSGGNIGSAEAGFVRAWTGYAIGGVPPFGHKEPIVTYIDNDLFAFDRVWAAAGGPRHVFETSANELLRVTDGVRAELKQ